MSTTLLPDSPTPAPAPAAALPAVSARGLVKVYGENRAVDGIDLEVRRGEIFGVLGPNGAGKTTTLSMLATLTRIDGGSAEVFGHDVVRDPHAVRQLIGVTGQYASVDEKLTARENLVLFGRLLGLSRSDARRRGEELLEQFGLTDAADRQIGKFSGGMRRRLDLAVSLVRRPPLIFLDEPTTGLDPRTRGQMWETIRQLVADGSTIVLTTQYLDEADQLADRIAVIDRGRKVAEGTPGQLKTQVGGSTLQLRLADPTQLARASEVLQAALAERPVPTPEAGALTVPLRDADQATDALVALRRHDLRVEHVTVAQPSLDEVFLALTGHDTSEPGTTTPGTNPGTTDETPTEATR